jgi:putative sigma-54 modulation protein
MKITFTGKQEKLTPSQERKLAIQFGKLSKLLEQRGEKGAQVKLDYQRRMQLAEVRLNYYDQALVGAGSGADQFTALMEAVEKIQKQALKIRTKFRDQKRETPTRVAKTDVAPDALVEPVLKGARKSKTRVVLGAESAPDEAAPGAPARIIRANSKSNGKPMTIDEAVLALDEKRDYLVYRDAATEAVRVLVRRRDGLVDLIEA